MSARPKIKKIVKTIPLYVYYIPQGVSFDRLDEVNLTMEELEALNLKDREGFDQSDAAKKMDLNNDIPIVLGGGDTQLGLLSCGAINSGETGVVAGTSTPVMKVLSEPVVDDKKRIWTGCHVIKNKFVLENAYNDSKQITAAFNKNILNVVNRLVDTDFNPDHFEHVAFYNTKEARIEMHLKAKLNIEVNSPYADKKIIIKESELIHTENSYKFTKKHITDFGVYSGLKINNVFSDTKNRYSLVHMIK